jgi:hypothetical protein
MIDKAILVFYLYYIIHIPHIISFVLQYSLTFTGFLIKLFVTI